MNIFLYTILNPFLKRSSIERNPATNKNIGFISPELSKKPEEECIRTPASKLMLIMLRGMCHHWKQIVGYFFTGVTRFLI
jgi:hypothetical protein